MLFPKNTLTTEVKQFTSLLQAVTKKSAKTQRTQGLSALAKVTAFMSYHKLTKI